MGEDVVDASFERELRDLLAAFGDGEEVSGEWTISSVPGPTPDWRVTVERDGEKVTSPTEVVGEAS